MNKKSFRNPLSKVFSGRASRDGAADGTSAEALREEIRRLEQSVETLSILNDLAVAMSRAADPEGAVEKLVDRSMRAVDAEQATVTLLDRGADKSGPLETQVRVVTSSAEHQSFHVNESLAGWMLLNKKSLLIDDPHNDDRFRGLSWDETVRSVMCLPLLVKSELTGVLTIYNKKGGAGFTKEDERLMSIIGAQSAQIIDNARLAQDKNRMEEQIKLAFDIQSNLLPASPPVVEGYDIAGKSIPAQSVGGDYFDFIPIDDGKLAVCLGDVSGKGLPASLLMANVQATLRGQTLVDAPASERVGRANKLLCECTDDERFVTLFYGVLDPEGHELVYCSAGHERPFVFAADGVCRRLDLGGLALGVFDTIQYEQETITLAPGDALVVFSDGITDAANTLEEQFGEERLAASIGEHRGETAEVLVNRIIDGVKAHEAGAAQFDDLTLVVVKRTK
jgi:sigma-B regulation protein RsbU (phosphoserine phosphatase)